MTSRDPSVPTLTIPAQNGKRTLKCLYLFAGIERKSSIEDHLAEMCKAQGHGLQFWSIDVLIGGKGHDLLDKYSQERFISMIEDGYFDIQILSPPCGSWSRANWSNQKGPAPCRDRQHPWGLPNMELGQRRRCERGNKFIHFSLRAIAAAQVAKSRGFRTMSLWEHPEDLGRTQNGEPAAVWQLSETRSAFGTAQSYTAAGHQCQFDLDASKPTRLFSDIEGILAFGVQGWPTFDAAGWYSGPLPRCGHKHKMKTIGTNSKGGFHISPTAAYPPKMCRLLAKIIFDDWIQHLAQDTQNSPCGLGSSSQTQPTPTPRKRVSFNPVVTRPPTRSTASAQDSLTSDWQQGLPEATADRNKIITTERIQEASDEIEARSREAPIKDGLKLDGHKPEMTDAPNEITTDEETEHPGTTRPKKGAGWWGFGPPIRPLKKGVPRDFVDGAGLCSPGRWPISQRRIPDDYTSKRLQKVVRDGLLKSEKVWKSKKPEMDLKRMLMNLALGKLDKSPFDDEILREVRTELRIICKQAGHGDGLPREGDVVQHFEIRLIQALLSAFQDPDWYFCDWWAVGVWLGSPSRKLPRAPAIFDRKTRWRKIEPWRDFFSDELHGGWQTNYPSLVEHARLVRTQFEGEERERLMTRTTIRKAMNRYGDALNIASAGAIGKKGRTDEVRVIFDGSHGIDLNSGIRVRDQIKYPIAADGKELMSEMADEGGPHFSVQVDFSKAHRQVAVLEEEWGRQACQIDGSAAKTAKQLLKAEATKDRKVFEETGKRARLTPRSRPTIDDLPNEVLEEEVWLNTVGTFGVASAGYWWGRAGAAIVRLTHYMLGLDNMIWAVLYADDEWLTGRTTHFERGLMLHMFVLAVLNAPMAWHKVGGGIQSEWVGYFLDVGRFEIGINEARACWAANWLEDKARERSVRLGELREGLGRLQFIAGPLEHLRPFLGPLYAWACAGPRYAKPRMPPMILLIITFLAGEVRRRRMARSAAKRKDMGELFRLDAKAEGEEVAIGGWRITGDGKTKAAPWFAVRLNRRNAPWAFARGEAFRTIASLELLGILVSVMVLFPDEEMKAESLGSVSLTCGTDNQGNAYLLDKMLTTKYPLGVVLMELAVQIGLRNAVLRANWIPRLQNEEADALTNSDFRHFDQARRIEVDLAKLEFRILNQLFAVGDNYIEELAKVKDQEKRRKETSSTGARQPRRKKSDTLRERDPW